MTSQSSLPIRFSGWKQRLSLFIAFSLLLSTLLLLSPPGHAQAASLNAAVSYADSHWNWTYYDPNNHSTVGAGAMQPNFQCAEFVARALAAAGLLPGLTPNSAQTGGNSYGSYQGYNLLSITSTSGLYNYLANRGLVTNIGHNLGQASPGDVVVFSNSSGVREHTVLITSVGSSNSSTLMDAHNAAWYHKALSYEVSGFASYFILHINAYRIVNYNSGKCLDVANYGTSNGNNVQQWGCLSPSATNQLWIAVPTNKTWSGYPVDQIVEFGTDECLDAYNWGTANGTNVDIWKCGSSVQNNQLWIVQSTIWNTYIWNYGATVARGIHVNLDVVCTSGTGYGQNNGANVQLWQDAPNSACSGHNQIWTFGNPY